MARVPCLVTANILLILSVFLSTSIVSSEDKFAPHFDALLQSNNFTKNENFTKVQFEVRGRNIYSDLQIKTTKEKAARGAPCTEDLKYPIVNVDMRKESALYEIQVPRGVGGEFYFCLPHQNPNYRENENKLRPNVLQGGRYEWHHQGPEVVIRVPLDNNDVHRDRRQKKPDELQIMGLRLEVHEKEAEYDEDGIPEVLAEAEHTIRIFGINFAKSMVVTFTDRKSTPDRSCQFPKSPREFPLIKGSFSSVTGRIKIKLPAMGDADTLYICAKETNSSFFVHQGDDVWLQIRSYEPLLPLGVTILIIVVCLMFSALFSGLNLGLMSLDRTELKILCNTGTPKERTFAKIIQPVRDHGNYLLCSILLGNVFVNSIFTILLDGLTSGLVAVIFSTIAIVLIGEITPQAICSRHGLAIGARTIYITKFVMVLTFPMAYPVSKFLDCVLGEEIGNVYNRERLKELVKVTTGENDLDKDEVNIISGALELRKKTVADVMTKIEDVFMLDYDNTILDFETVSEIMKSGYSRVPVFEGNRQNIVTMLYIKDLAFVDPDDNTPLKTLCQFYQNPCNFVFEDVTLDVMFRIFKEGNKGHMAFVHRVNNEGEGDPFYETIGLITLEDVIEELIQAEIMDETDVFTDNRTKRRRNAERRQDFSVFAERKGEPSKIRISPQLTLAAYQFLSTAVELFLPTVISETILKRLLRQDIIYHIKKNKEWRTDPANVIYQQGKNADYFVLILEGRVEVTIGKENLTFEGGPFTFFGTQALVQTIGVAESPSAPTSTLGSLESLNLDALLRHTFQPDYTVRASNEVIYLRIKRSLYLAAKRATLMERSQRDLQQSNDQFDEEVDKLLHSLEEDDTESAGRRTPRKQSSKNLHHNQEANLSPKTPSIYSNVSPPHRLSHDINGSIIASPVEDCHNAREEEVSLLAKKS
ncbi:unextended protein [Tribolium castaneum]|uniref:Metal transporter CNNM2-like Protein n=1 Tax=Tribolium castaneum TaxID=7070 RepID=D6W9C1_TRICA|nr:PREDICTED: metal transporter CNNM4 [Tribolium castaneum]EEZ98477.1 Metal transporter CNNM2-like Protein [Tribolium castaneum]|eukprot:XP_969313.1 PREDICTED: metal transporter CNNM4 [Tribolium castaneum]